MRISDWSSDVCSSDLKVASIANAIILSLAKPFAIEDDQVRIGASVGIAVADGSAVRAAALARNADLALYTAQYAGGGVYRFYAVASHAESQERHAKSGRGSGRGRVCLYVYISMDGGT